MRSTRRSIANRTQAGDLQLALRQGVGAVLAAQREALRAAVAETDKFSAAVGREIRQIQARRIGLLRGVSANASTRLTASWVAVERRIDRYALPALERLGLAGAARYGVALAGRGVDAVTRQIDPGMGAPKRSLKKNTQRSATARRDVPKAGAGAVPRRRATS